MTPRQQPSLRRGRLLQRLPPHARQPPRRGAGARGERKDEQITAAGTELQPSGRAAVALRWRPPLRRRGRPRGQGTQARQLRREGAGARAEREDENGAAAGTGRQPGG